MNKFLSKEGNQDVAKFYDQYSLKLLKEYLHDQLRTRSAILYVLSSLNPQASKILDIGCGIGWSSHEIATHLRAAKVIGIDLSPQLIKTAKQLFVCKNLDYKNLDATSQWVESGCDAVVMLDVYEHIAKSERPAFHKKIDHCLKDNAQVIITCPSPQHQQRLRDENPGGLQPIDEDVGLDELQCFAKDISGQLTNYSLKTLWNPGDYIYAVLSRGVWKTNKAVKTRQFSSPKLESPLSRGKRIRSSGWYGQLKADVDYRLGISRKIKLLWALLKNED